MTANRGLFVRNSGAVGTTPIEGRLVLAAMVAENAPGVPRQGLLDQRNPTPVTGHTNMSYNVGPLTVVTNRATNEGVYMFTLTGTTNVATTAAPGSNSRYDLIYVKQNDPDKGDTGNTATLAVLQGTAAASPSKPYGSLPAGAYVLAEALVQTGATATNGANVTITQVWKHTALRGVPIPIRNVAERDEITGALGMELIRLDCENWKQIHDGTGWKFDGWRRSTAPITWFMGAGTVSRQIAYIGETKPYARRVNVYGRLTVYCPSISSGREEINVVVSAAVTQVGSAQAKSRLNWGPGSSNSDVNQTASATAQNVYVGAGGDVMARIWIEVISGAVSLTPSAGTYSELYFDYIPEND
ncbi:minor tail protein [Arthrobacter phage VResidence]|uniref:Minor tail protein n=1 Tax=Arthrobacter phage VResidence TaxID=2927294 RepID=A0A9X9P6K9_9CAUD|nr:minor tail protein [Arthrobacter phage VResidence]